MRISNFLRCNVSTYLMNQQVLSRPVGAFLVLTGLSMRQKETTEQDELAILLPYARWLEVRMREKGTNLKRVAEATEIDYSYLWKVKHAHRPKYAEYRRPGYDVARKIGEHLGDRLGSLIAAEYETKNGDGAEGAHELSGNGNRYDTEPPDSFEDWPADMQDALARIKDWPPEMRRFVWKAFLTQIEFAVDLVALQEDSRQKLEERERQLKNKPKNQE